MSAVLKGKPAPLLTWDQYEQAELKSEIRHEFANGHVFAMAGGTRNHNRIALNTATSLQQQLRGKKCEAFMADVKLRIDLHREHFGYYPDVMVVCDPADRSRLHVTRPAVVFEVLSKSTERIDRREKLLAYQAVESLQVYVLIEQTHPQAIIYRRSSLWQSEVVNGFDAVIELPEIEVQMPLSVIYERVDWQDEEPDGNDAA